MLMFPDLHQLFDIETYTYEYAIGEFLTQKGHSMVYHNETLFDAIHRYSTYEKEMYSIV